MFHYRSPAAKPHLPDVSPDTLAGAHHFPCFTWWRGIVTLFILVRSSLRAFTLSRLFRDYSRLQASRPAFRSRCQYAGSSVENNSLRSFARCLPPCCSHHHSDTIGTIARGDRQLDFCVAWRYMRQQGHPAYRVHSTLVLTLPSATHISPRWLHWLLLVWVSLMGFSSYRAGLMPRHRALASTFPVNGRRSAHFLN